MYKCQTKKKEKDRNVHRTNILEEKQTKKNIKTKKNEEKEKIKYANIYMLNHERKKHLSNPASGEASQANDCLYSSTTA